MRPRAELMIAACCAVPLLGAPAGARNEPPGAPTDAAALADESLEQFLQDNGLDDLLAEQLWRRLNASPRAAQLELAQRLASLYSRLVVGAADADRQRKIERDVARLLAAVPEADTIDLRLNLARAAFSRAEPVLDRWRVRLAEEAQANDAAARAADLAREFAEIAGRAQQRVLTLERQEEAMRDRDDRVLAEALALARRHRSLARFQAGWACAISAEFDLAQRDALAGEALKHFGWLLNAAPGEPARPELAAAQMLRFEHVARAAIGAAVAEALRGGTDAAMRWIDLIESTEGVPPELTEQAFARRIQILGTTGRWELLQNWMRERRPGVATPGADADSLLSTAEARLIVVLAQESTPASDSERTAARVLSYEAVNHLLIAGEYGHAHDLADRYPALTHGDSFTAKMTRGLAAVEKARQATPADESTPAPPPEIAAMFARASDEFASAAAAAPSEAHRGAASIMLGSSLFEARADRDSLLRASTAFEEGAARLAPNGARAADAVWMAIRAAEAALILAPTDTEIERRRDGLLSRFVAAYPLDPRAGEVTLRRALATSGASEAMAVELLAIPESSAAYLPARREAARVLYENFLAAPEPDRAWAARRFVAVAEPLLASDARKAQPPTPDRAAAERAGVFARRIADALLAASPPDVAGAVRALDLVAQLVSAGVITDPEAAAEIEFRRVQIALIHNDTALAAQLMESIRARSGRFGALCDGLLFQEAARRWSSARASDDDRARASAAEQLIAAGRKLLSLEDTPNAAHLSSPDWTAIRVIVAEAAAELWRSRADESHRDLALLLYRIAVRERPNDASIIRGSAELDEAARDWAGAADKWSILLGAAPAGSSEWHAAKLRLLGALRHADPPRADEMLRQHRVLYPDLGPPPWREQYERIAAQLRADAGGAP